MVYVVEMKKAVGDVTVVANVQQILAAEVQAGKFYLLSIELINKMFLLLSELIYNCCRVGPDTEGCKDFCVK